MNDKKKSYTPTDFSEIKPRSLPQISMEDQLLPKPLYYITPKLLYESVELFYKEISSD